MTSAEIDDKINISIFGNVPDNVFGNTADNDTKQFDTENFPERRHESRLLVPQIPAAYCGGTGGRA